MNIRLIGLAVVFSILIVPVYNGIIAPGLTETGYASAFTTGYWFLKSSVGIFVTWPIFVVIALAWVFASFTARAKPETSRSAYMGGENVEIGTDEFVGLGDERTQLKTGGFYAESILGEKNLIRFIIPIGIVFLIVLFVLVML